MFSSLYLSRLERSVQFESQVQGISYLFLASAVVYTAQHKLIKIVALGQVVHKAKPYVHQFTMHALAICMQQTILATAQQQSIKIEC